jgi:glutamate synthase (NADPH/NADH) small chain
VGTVFWPGCGLAANRQGLVRKIRKILGHQLHKEVGLALDCCYAPVYGLGDTETALAALRETGKRLQDHGVRQVITGCLNCHKLLSEHLEDILVVFILEVLPPEIFKIQRMESIYLHHPCPSSRWETIRNKAKVLADHIHPSPGTDFTSVPISESTAAHCCGVGGSLNALYPDLADRFLNRISDERKNRTTVTYCIGCQNRLLKRGVEAIHLLECLPGVKPRRKIPSPFTQWAVRFALAMVERLNPLHGFRKIRKENHDDRRPGYRPPEI